MANSAENIIPCYEPATFKIGARAATRLEKGYQALEAVNKTDRNQLPPAAVLLGELVTLIGQPVSDVAMTTVGQGRRLPACGRRYCE